MPAIATGTFFHNDSGFFWERVMGLEPATFCWGSLGAFALWQECQKARQSQGISETPSKRKNASHRVNEDAITAHLRAQFRHAALIELGDALEKPSFEALHTRQRGAARLRRQLQ